MKKKRHSIVSMIFAGLFVLIITSAILVVGGLYAKFGPQVISLYEDARHIADSSKKDDFKATETSLIYDSEGKLIKTLKGAKDVYYINFENIPDYAKEAVICIEDKKFYKHNGIDLKANVRALIALAKNRGGITQGASTITQQLARNVYLTQEQKYDRKIKEIFLAMELEKRYSKKDILEFYLNNIYFSNGYYGIQAAANGYFRKGVASLSLSQIAFLCAIPNNPNDMDPYTNKERTLQRRDLILKQMYEDKKITREQYEEALAEKIKVKKKKEEKNSGVETFIMDCAVEALMQKQGFEFRNEFTTEAEKTAYDLAYSNLYAQCQQSLYKAGYRIYTSIDMEKQEKLQKSIDDALAAYQETNPKTGIYKVQGAATCIDNESGRVVSIVGGRTQKKTNAYSLNRAFQSYRQPGSSIKPLIVYTPAMEKGYTPDSMVMDQPIKGETDGPKNDDNSYSGRIRLRSAVASSKNVVAWRLFEELTPEVGLSYLKKMGYHKIIDKYAQPNDYNPSASIGGFTYGSNTLEMASGYATIENDGEWRKPTCIVKITDTSGTEIVGEEITKKDVYEKNAARMMTSVLETVVQSGTGRGLGVTNMPSAGKTGTTDNNKDGWFCGFTPYYTTSVWIGYDTPTSWSALYGGTFPGRVWHDFMEQIHEGLEPKEFEPYENMPSKKDTTETLNKTTADEATTEENDEDEDEDENEPKSWFEKTNETPTEAPTLDPTEAQVTQAPVTQAPPTQAAPTQAPATSEAATQAPPSSTQAQ